jgi:hypothetical protein
VVKVYSRSKLRCADSIWRSAFGLESPTPQAAINAADFRCSRGHFFSEDSERIRPSDWFIIYTIKQRVGRPEWLNCRLEKQSKMQVVEFDSKLADLREMQAGLALKKI